MIDGFMFGFSGLSPTYASYISSVVLDTTHPKRSVRLRRKCSGWDDDKRMRVLQIQLL